MMERRPGPKPGQREGCGMEPKAGDQDVGTEAVALARRLYLDEGHPYGCAETCFMVLKSAYGLEDPMDPSAAIALNGGVGWSGAMCGSLTGAALAVGMLAERRMPDHARAKLVARELVAGALTRFREVHGSLDCRELIGYDLRAPGEHEAFLDSGLWRTRCMVQIETVVAHLATFADEGAWECAVSEIEAHAVH
jgi:C_GCAxxG_C_C family probable redox protein